MTTRETRGLELKQSVTRTFLKTVSAFANYGTGRIIFGIDDDGKIVGLANPIGDCLKVENMINDCFEPVPRYTLEPDERRKTITLTVFEGADKPYRCSGKAYIRNDSSTVEVDRLEYGRLVLEGNNTSYDELPSPARGLKFTLLEEHLCGALGIESLSGDVMRTLVLMTQDGAYTNAAAMLADSNAFKGVDIVRFGDNANQIMDRIDLVGVSAITQLEGAMEVFDKYYRFDEVVGRKRKQVETIPAEAFREAMANAIVHRAWDVSASITVGMYHDKIEITSPGALPPGLSEDEYLNGRISLLRNPILANVFFRLRYIEKFGTGIMRIRDAYTSYRRQPVFEVRRESVSVTLPTADAAIAMSTDEDKVYGIISDGRICTRAEVERMTGFSKDKAIRLLNSLVDKGAIEKTGSARGTRYSRK